MSSGLQHAQSAHPSQEPELPSPGLQLQPQACQNPHHQGMIFFTYNLVFITIYFCYYGVPNKSMVPIKAQRLQILKN